MNLNLQIGDPEVVRDNFYKIQQAFESMPGGTSVWGGISGTITDQDDLIDYIDDATEDGNTAFSWGNHASAGYLTAHQDEEDIEGDTLENTTASGTVTLDLETFIDYRLNLTGNTTLSVSNTPASGKSIVRNVTIISSTSQTLTLPGTWNVYGSYYSSGVRNKLTIIFSNFSISGLQVDCFISQPNL